MGFASLYANKVALAHFHGQHRKTQASNEKQMGPGSFQEAQPLDPEAPKPNCILSFIHSLWKGKVAIPK